MSRFKCSRYARGFNFTEWFICRVVSIAGLASLTLHAVGLTPVCTISMARTRVG
ncbi:hypothetical protein L210DRAFT_953776 [Boletus edulis BED1]|uniref:Uncharacterized protein n=1 Tax=Boletus edulis BED1 TaxID=1328754 RepID=A0AAD4GBQ3_BOLED|nr:hypothetical protein L210DRAFT_953776 [Boletus edulis BED1]